MECAAIASDGIDEECASELTMFEAENLCP
jgi:hypothetical protein